MFTAGKKVRFKQIRPIESGFMIESDYELDYIPDEWLQHGNLQTRVNEGEIVGFYEAHGIGYVAVRYIDINGQQPCLGFKEEQLELVDNTVWPANSYSIKYGI